MSAELGMSQDPFEEILSRLKPEVRDWIIGVLHGDERGFNLVHRVWTENLTVADEYRNFLPVLVLPDGSKEADIAKDTHRAIARQTTLDIPEGTPAENILREAAKQLPAGKILLLIYPDANGYVEKEYDLSFLRDHVPVGVKAVLATQYHEEVPFPIYLS